MITEDYVSFETAKLLKEKGFDEPCKVWYSEYTLQFCDKKYIVIQFDKPNRFRENYKFMCSAPTIQMAMKWLKEEKHIFIELLVDTMINGAFTWRLFEYPSLETMPYDGWEYTYEEACESGIKYCLENLI